MFNFIKNLFEEADYKREVPDSVRKEAHDLIDCYIDCPNRNIAFDCKCRALKKIDSICDLYELKRIKDK